MASLRVKPGVQLAISDWSSNNHQLCESAQRQRHASTNVRQEVMSLRSETSCQTLWDESASSRCLADRVSDVSRWKKLLENSAQKVDEEMGALTLAKEQTEHALFALALPLAVTRECVALREGRRGVELVVDAVDEQLKEEEQLILKVQQLLQQHVDSAFQQLCVLQEVRHQLTADIQNKMAAVDIDLTCLNLSAESPQISLKPDPTRVPQGASTPQEWTLFSQRNTQRAQEAVEAAQQLREEMKLRAAQLQNDLETQRRATEFSLRKRGHEEEQARDELQWQSKKTEEEAAQMQREIHALDADLQAKSASLKLAHTRLERRSSRPGLDLCRDEVQHGLVHEVHQLETTIKLLNQKLSEAQLSLQRMNLVRARVLQVLALKEESLSLEQRSLGARTRLRPPTSDALKVLLVPLMNSSGRSNLQQ